MCACARDQLQDLSLSLVKYSSTKQTPNSNLMLLSPFCGRITRHINQVTSSEQSLSRFKPSRWTAEPGSWPRPSTASHPKRKLHQQHQTYRQIWPPRGEHPSGSPTCIGPFMRLSQCWGEMYFSRCCSRRTPRIVHSKVLAPSWSSCSDSFISVTICQEQKERGGEETFSPKESLCPERK